jgi:hypothetical protein
MMHWKTIAAGATIAGSLGLAALGLGSGLANAAPTPLATQVSFSQWGGGGYYPHGGRHDWGGPGWGAPPAAYGYGGYGYGVPPPCVSGPLGLVHVCA